jgi:NAD(P)-dependent dehydrogenase (short-subunit alcohol dehydrogenase family)
VAQELADRGITVNASPGFMTSAMTERSTTSSARHLSRIPLGAMGSGADIGRGGLLQPRGRLRHRADRTSRRDGDA